MSMVKPLFVASIASLTLMMTSVRSTIDLLQKMGILPTVGRCSNCSMTTGTYKSEGLYNYFRCSNCKKKQSLLQNTVLSNSNTTLHDFVLLMYQFCNSHRTYNTVAKETFLPQQLKKWKCTPIKLFDIIKVANDFCKSSNFWKTEMFKKVKVLVV